MAAGRRPPGARACHKQSATAKRRGGDSMPHPRVANARRAASRADRRGVAGEARHASRVPRRRGTEKEPLQKRRNVGSSGGVGGGGRQGTAMPGVGGEGANRWRRGGVAARQSRCVRPLAPCPQGVLSSLPTPPLDPPRPATGVPRCFLAGKAGAELQPDTSRPRFTSKGHIVVECFAGGWTRAQRERAHKNERSNIAPHRVL